MTTARSVANQILLPLMSVVADDTLRSELRSMGREAQRNIVADRGLLVEAQVLEILAELMSSSERPVVPVSDIVTGLVERYGGEYDRPITNRWVGERPPEAPQCPDVQESRRVRGAHTRELED